jgi:glycosyltransferase involved in cell wall biosynthesis
MRVAYDVSAAMRLKSGVGYYVLSLLSALADRDDLSLSTYALTVGGHRLLDHAHRLRRWAIPGRAGPNLWTRIGYPSGELLTGPADVVHGTNFWIPPLRHRNGVVTIHDLAFAQHPEFVSPTVSRYRQILPKVLDRCAGVIAPSRTVADGITSELGVPPEQITVTYEGAREVFARATFNPESASRLGVHGDFVMYAGQFEPRKNMLRLLRAFASLEQPGLKLILAGPKGAESRAVEAQIRKSKLDSKAVITGYLSESELASLMAGARAFAFPSIYEGFGLPPIEAMSAGVPVVAARSGSLPEILDGAPFWCDPLDESSIAKALLIAVSDEAARTKAIALGRTRAAFFTWDRVAGLTVEAYRRANGGSTLS